MREQRRKLSCNKTFSVTRKKPGVERVYEEGRGLI